MDIVEIDNTIKQLEDGATTFDSCQKLASLYVVREHISNNEVIEEYSDILPSYNKYCDIKRRFQLGELSDAEVIKYMERLCNEIREFMVTLWSNTDMPQERNSISIMIKLLGDTF